jgi:hypothetical protein
LASTELGQRAQIFKRSIPLKDVFETEIAEIDKRKRQENEAVAEMETKRIRKKERGRTEIMGRPNQETIHKLQALPVCTRTPRMLITGEIIAYRKSVLCTNILKYLHPQRSGIY